MFIYSVKAQNLKLIFSLFFSVVIILAVVLLAPTDYQPESVEAGKVMEKSDFKNIITNEDRVAFLNLYGWEVNPEATSIKEITIPSEFDSTYQDYNEMQKKDGFDLEKYKGKSVKQYTYLVSNYEYDGSVFANLIVYRNTVIGGDICSAKTDGFMHGLTKGNENT